MCLTLYGLTDISSKYPAYEQVVADGRFGKTTEQKKLRKERPPRLAQRLAVAAKRLLHQQNNPTAYRKCPFCDSSVRANYYTRNIVPHWGSSEACATTASSICDNHALFSSQPKHVQTCLSAFVSSPFYKWKQAQSTSRKYCGSLLQNFHEKVLKN